MKAVTLVLIVAAVQGALAQPCVPPKNAPVVSYPSGTMLSKVGSSDMPITTKSEKARRLCQQGFALIHGFWFFEAIRSFRDATKEDPTCAIAWAGLNVALTQPWNRRDEYRGEAEYAIQKAISHVNSASEIEQTFIRAIRLRSFDGDDRGTVFEREMQKLINEHPTLAEPRLVWAGLRCQLCMSGYCEEDVVRGDLIKVAELVDPILKRDGKNMGALHYAIHAYEPRNPDKAVEYALRLAALDSESPHLVHMPGHIFFRVGRYQEALEAFRKSQRVDEAYAEKLGVTPGDADWQYGHNLAFMTVNLIEMGKLREAAEVGAKSGSQISVLVRQGKWADLVKFPWPNGLHEKVPTLASVYRGRLLLEQGDIAGATAKVESIEKYLSESRDVTDVTTYRVLKAETEALAGEALAAKGEYSAARQRLEESIRTYHETAYSEPPHFYRLPHETLGFVLIRAGENAEAIRAFQSGLKERPHSGWLLYGIAFAYEKAGDRVQARRAYEKVIKEWPTADADLPEMIHARAYLGQD